MSSYVDNTKYAALGSMSDEEQSQLDDRVDASDSDEEDVPEPTTMGQVDLIASGYEWICPMCENLNKEIEAHSPVTCSACAEDFGVEDILHAVALQYEGVGGTYE